ncbi:MAG TPA: CIA30 family protein [Candidatus Sulfotelmatobacter sp.]|nr:CIA30 family protein [Candidatus Sulfotelmatobacter sp.]
MKPLVISSLSALLIVVNSPAEAAPGEETKAGTNSTQTLASQPAAGMLRLADFEQGKLQTVAAAPWQAFTDSLVGGKSTVQVAVGEKGAQGSQHALVLTGKLTPDYQWGGFVGVKAPVQPDGAPKNLTAFPGVEFYARGDGRTYRVLVSKESVKDWNHFYSEFAAPADWTLVQVPFAKLERSPYATTQVNWSAEDVTAVGFLAMSEPGISTEVKLEIDNVRFYTK